MIVATSLCVYYTDGMGSACPNLLPAPDSQAASLSSESRDAATACGAAGGAAAATSQAKSQEHSRKRSASTPFASMLPLASPLGNQEVRARWC